MRQRPNSTERAQLGPRPLPMQSVPPPGAFCAQPPHRRQDAKQPGPGLCPPPLAAAAPALPAALPVLHRRVESLRRRPATLPAPAVPQGRRTNQPLSRPSTVPCVTAAACLCERGVRSANACKCTRPELKISSITTIVVSSLIVPPPNLHNQPD